MEIGEILKWKRVARYRCKCDGEIRLGQGSFSLPPNHSLKHGVGRPIRVICPSYLSFDGIPLENLNRISQEEEEATMAEDPNVKTDRLAARVGEAARAVEDARKTVRGTVKAPAAMLFILMASIGMGMLTGGLLWPGIAFVASLLGLVLSVRAANTVCEKADLYGKQLALVKAEKLFHDHIMDPMPVPLYTEDDLKKREQAWMVKTRHVVADAFELGKKVGKGDRKAISELRKTSLRVSERRDNPYNVYREFLKENGLGE
jgi:hypothetical protein